MPTVRSSKHGFCLSLSVGFLLTACGGSDTPPPIAEGAEFRTLEETPYSGAVKATTTTGDPIRYTLSSEPTHGAVTVDLTTGAFTYTPNQDYFGNDAFQFRATDGHLLSEPAVVSIQIDNVNDRPVFAAIGNMMNSAETLASTVALSVIDVDGDAIFVTASSGNTNVATVETDSTSATITIEPISRGTTQILVKVRDAEFESEQEFSFMVGDVTKSRTVEADMTAGDALMLTNESAQPVALTLEHNGFPMFRSETEMAQFVRDIAPEYPNEPFERKLWRFVRDSVYHDAPLNTDTWLNDPWVVINSLGSGFCGHVSATYSRIARAGGYEARVYGLSGHVVPEIKINDRWEMFDPDLAVYYFTPDLKIAGVGELEADATLLTLPITPVFAGSTYDFPYSLTVADLYGTSSNNSIEESYLSAFDTVQYPPLVLPVGAHLTYPGKWTSEVEVVDGVLPYKLQHYLQAMLTTTDGWTGNVSMPWMLREIRGAGRVKVLGQEYEIGSPDLISLLTSAQHQLPDVEILDASSDVQFIFFINSMRYGLAGENLIRVTGKDVWAVNIERSSLPIEAQVNSAKMASLRKPTF